MVAFFEQAQLKNWEGIDYSYSQKTETGHHRIEHRQVWVVGLDQLPELSEAKKWKGLASIVMVKRERQLWNKKTTEVCFYITSLAADALILAEAIRAHWGVENSLHWVLDVTFKEDSSRIRQGHGPEHNRLIRRLCINLLKREPSKKSIAMKRYLAAMDNNYAFKVLSLADYAQNL